ncbi:hypothetical protein G7Y89_g12824 [Cudoniella acicularis]|uniref:Uncharacterized protein n=1 Tax=Cudoniella acicularis TaxID=354080 RepID=A0A8H4VX04_9HELO|nr:hypothetical protein G7Y89_g12824 [Cudoniella acicularis]
MTPASCWKGAPPMWMVVGGGEMTGDAQRIVARDIAKEGGRVGWVEAEKMPHLFTGFVDWWQGARGVELWGKAIREMFEGSFEGGGIVLGVDGQEREVDVKTLTGLKRGDLLEVMRIEAGKLEIWIGENYKGPKRKL